MSARRGTDRVSDVDVVVVGLGVLGASTLWALARDGRRVLGLDRFGPGHDRGSSHGRSRAVRFLYHAPEYVALLRPAIDGWRALEAESRTRLYWDCGTLFFARPGNELLRQNMAIAAAGGIHHESLDDGAARRRFPALAMTPGAEGVFSEDGGMIDADAAVASFTAGARAAGADIRPSTRVRAIHSDGGAARVTTDAGDITAGHVVVAAGAWTTHLLPQLDLPIRVTRQSWVTMRAGGGPAVDPGHIPVWADYDTMIYGFPDHGPGLKIAVDTPGPAIDPDSPDRGDLGEERRQLVGHLRDRFPRSALTADEVGTCLYTLTPDDDFLLGGVPGSDGTASVVVGLNHAFKFAPVIGRILADLATTGTTPFPIDRFRVERFAGGTAD